MTLKTLWNMFQHNSQFVNKKTSVIGHDIKLAHIILVKENPMWQEL